MKRNIVFLLAFLFVSGCSHYAGSFKSNNTPGQINESFSNFNKSEAVKLSPKEADILFVSYGLQLKQGQLEIAVLHENEILWNKKLSEQNDTTNFQLTLKEGENYTIKINGKHAEGSLLLNYKTVAPKKINVINNANLELFGLMLQLDAGPQIEKLTDTLIVDGRKGTWKDWYLLAYNNYQRYKAFDSCSMMQLYRQYQEKHYTDDFFVGFLEQVDEVPNARLNNTTNKESILSFAGNGDEAAGRRIASAFLDSFNSFYRAIHFEKFLEENETNFQQARMDVEKNLPPPAFVPIMENFYKKSFNDYNLVPVMNLLTSSGYGKMNTITKSIYNAFAPFSFQSFNPQHLDLGFDYRDKIQGLSLHEFGHSFVNSAIDKLPDEIKTSTEYLYLPIKEAMSKKSYTNWIQCLYEHFVKTGEVIIARELGDNKHAEEIIRSNVADGFIYLSFLVKQMELYEKDTNPDKSYDAYVVTIMKRLKDAYPK